MEVSAVRYNFKCGNDHIFEVLCSVAERKEPRRCAECGEEAVYDFTSTMKEATHYYEENLEAFMDRLGFQPPGLNGPEGKCRAGGQNLFPGDPRTRNRWT